MTMSFFEAIISLFFNHDHDYDRHGKPLHERIAHDVRRGYDCYR
jgi:hypothetical protein